MISNNASFRVLITGGKEAFLDSEDERCITILLYLPEVEKEMVYESIPLEDFDSPEAVMEYVDDIKGDAILLNCDFDSTDGFEKLLEEVFYEPDDSYNEVEPEY